jgi:nucleoside-diphosphate-sugar epimerase
MENSHEHSGRAGDGGRMRTALVTGATGLLGGNLVRELDRRGWVIRALVRDAARARRLLSGVARLTPIVGDLERVDQWAAALDGVDVVFHAAAYFRESYRGGSHWERLCAVNVDGTRALVDAAVARGVRRFLHVSSIGTLAVRRPDGRPVGAADHEDPDRTANDYFRSKILADRVVEDGLARHADLWAAFVLPGFMNGPGDSGPTAAGQMIEDFVARRLPGVVDAHLSYVDARDVASACVAAEARAPRGARYVVAGRRLHMREAYAILACLTGVPAPTRRVPMALLAVVAALNEAWARLTGKPVLLSRATYQNLRETGPYNAYDSSPSERELGVTFRPLEETLRDALAWLADGHSPSVSQWISQNSGSGGFSSRCPPKHSKLGLWDSRSAT